MTCHCDAVIGTPAVPLFPLLLRSLPLFKLNVGKRYPEGVSGEPRILELHEPLSLKIDPLTCGFTLRSVLFSHILPEASSATPYLEHAYYVGNVE